MVKDSGEKTDEDLISEREVNKTYIYGDDIHIRMEVNEGDNRLYDTYNSSTAQKNDSQRNDGVGVGLKDYKIVWFTEGG